jgi:hypothetical protein
MLHCFYYHDGIIHHDTETKDDLPPDGKCVADVWA